ncbi:MAG TPA: hypothetical protein VMF69_25240 [Gemmataceae bacterium]|nr:hypothetical protein [Gemmataceae bacterium]
MNTTWANLSPRELAAKADRLRRYSRDSHDPATFANAEAIDDLLSGVDPDAVQNSVDEARQAVKSGKLPIDDAVEGIIKTVNPFVPMETTKVQMLRTLFRRAVLADKPFAHVAQDFMLDGRELPNADEANVMRLQREQESIRFARQYGTPQPEQLRYSRDEINRGGALAAKRGISFDAAVQLLRYGR